MTEFHLRDAHPVHQRIIETTITALCQKYPWVRCDVVRTYEPTVDDHSLANTDVSKTSIDLNLRWFSLDPGILRKAAREIGNWHVISEEPRRVVTHEFGHLVEMQYAKVPEWSQARWEAATTDPSLSPSLYGCTNPRELFAECFCEYDLGLAPPERAAAMRDLLAELSTEDHDR
jgi:hypothetical protein